MEYTKESVSYGTKKLHIYNPDIRKDSDETLRLPQAVKSKHIAMIEGQKEEDFALSIKDINSISSIFFNSFERTITWSFVMPISIHVFVDWNEEVGHEEFLTMHAFLVGLIAGFLERKQS